MSELLGDLKIVGLFVWIFMYMICGTRSRLGGVGMRFLESGADHDFGWGRGCFSGSLGSLLLIPILRLSNRAVHDCFVHSLLRWFDR